MSAPGLAARDTVVRERMDDQDCDPAKLRHTYALFGPVNRLVAGWRGVYERQLRPLCAGGQRISVLDVGCGGGDVARALARWARRDGLSLQVTGIDPDERAYAFAVARPPVPGVTLRRAGSAELVAEGASYDVVISNHVLHHLGPDELAGLLGDSERLARRLVVHNDLARSRLAYLAYAVVSRPFARRSFLHVDGLLSIRRSYRAAELAGLAGPGWRVVRAFPARLLLVRMCDTNAGSASGPGTMRDMRPAILFTAAATSYAANCALGAAVATRRLDTSRFSWLHHALYSCTSALAGGAASSLLWSRSQAGWWLLPAAVPLVLIPRVSARSRRHPQIALSAAPFFAAALIKAWR